MGTTYTTTSVSASNESLVALLNSLNISSDAIAIFSGFIFAFIFIIFFVFIILYIFKAIGLQSLAKKAGYENTWLAWIPIVDAFLFGKVATKNIGLAWAYLIFSVLAFFLNFPLEQYITVVIYFVLYYFLFKRYTNKYVGLTILNVLTAGIAGPFILFAIRKNEPIE